MSRRPSVPAAQSLEAFWVSFATPPSSVWVGIDPGMAGAIALLADGRPWVADLPVVRPRTTSGSVRSDFDYPAIVSVFRTLLAVVPAAAVTVCLEEAQNLPTDTPKTARQVGWSCGMWPLFCAQLQLPLVRVSPVTWKRFFRLLGADKTAVLHAARQRWPTAELSLLKDHHRAEALFLAEYVRIQRGGRL